MAGASQRGYAHCRRPRRIPGFSDFLIFGKMLIFWIFPVGFGVREGLQRIGSGCGLEMDGFSAHFERYESILDDFHEFVDFEFVSGGLMLIPEGPRTLPDRSEGPGTL